MIEREKIITKVKDIVEKNKLEQSFLPIIEEFFIRSVDQYNWTEEDLDNAIESYKNVEIKFSNFKNFKNILLYRRIIVAHCDYGYDKEMK